MWRNTKASEASAHSNSGMSSSEMASSGAVPLWRPHPSPTPHGLEDRPPTPHGLEDQPTGVINCYPVGLYLTSSVRRQWNSALSPAGCGRIRSGLYCRED